ncbi:acyl carrier protein [Sphingopyxis sp.]|uniref:acyl carrier protein n=1 Tax=Sphingopyxis sp. TaxID=1908224 RepID=UPI0025D1120A|nr:acyl carrier protein [Sphingopyxis sp.]MBK6414322.1 acyl carrier protein [Sphingopyxis sp.]
MDSTSRQVILDQINAIVSDVLRLPDLCMDEATTANDVPGWDSLTHIQIIIEIERKYGVRFTSTEVAQLEDAGSLIELVIKHS